MDDKLYYISLNDLFYECQENSKNNLKTKIYYIGSKDWSRIPFMNVEKSS